MYNDFPIFTWDEDRYFEVETCLFALSCRNTVRRRELFWGADGCKFLIKMNNRWKNTGQVDGSISAREAIRAGDFVHFIEGFLREHSHLAEVRFCGFRV